MNDDVNGIDEWLAVFGQTAEPEPAQFPPALVLVVLGLLVWYVA